MIIGEISLTSPIVINVPTRASLAVETKGLLFLWLAYLNNKSNVCKQISSLLSEPILCHIIFIDITLFFEEIVTFTGMHCVNTDLS